MDRFALCFVIRMSVVNCKYNTFTLIIIIRVIPSVYSTFCSVFLSFALPSLGRISFYKNYCIEMKRGKVNAVSEHNDACDVYLNVRMK